MSTKPTLTNHQGFTLIELLIITPILMLTLSVILVYMVNLLTLGATTDSQLTVTHETQTALDSIERDVHVGAKFLVTTDPGYNDPYGPDNAGATWSYVGSSPYLRTLIIRAYATTKSLSDSSKSPVYVNQFGCTSAVINSNPPLFTNIIYFVRNGNLYRRVLTDTSQTTCDPPFQQQSCPSDAGTPNVICKGTDTLLASNVNIFGVSYYQHAGDFYPIDAYNSSDPVVLDASNTLAVQINRYQNIGGDSQSYYSAIQVTKLNQ